MPASTCVTISRSPIWIRRPSACRWPARSIGPSASRSATSITCRRKRSSSHWSARSMGTRCSRRREGQPGRRQHRRVDRRALVEVPRSGVKTSAREVLFKRRRRRHGRRVATPTLSPVFSTATRPGRRYGLPPSHSGASRHPRHRFRRDLHARGDVPTVGAAVSVQVGPVDLRRRLCTPAGIRHIDLHRTAADSSAHCRRRPEPPFPFP
jgi:hypothetical protein